MNNILSQIDTPGGHVLVCLLLIAIGCTMYKLHIPKAEDVIVGASAVIFAVMRGRGGDK